MHEQNTPKGHACLISYSETTEADFPLVLVVGREPNEDMPPSDECGTYNFRTSSTCAFWNVAYGLLGSVALPPRSTGQMKDMAEGAASSPILFADALPITLRHAAKSKAAQRLAISDAAIQAHVSAVFSHRHLVDRVHVIILSGLDASFKRSVEHYQRMAAERGIALFHLPFFYPTNLPKIRDCITSDLRTNLSDIAVAFEEYAGQRRGLAA